MKIKFNDLNRHHKAFQGDFHKALDQLLGDSQFILGPHLQRFEREFANFVGTAFAVGVSTGLSALSLAIRAASLKVNTEVIVPVNSFVASAHAVLQNGLVPRFVDVRRCDHLIDPNAILNAVNANTSAILPVHLHGRVAPMIEICDIASRFELTIIEDAAQAAGATYHGKMAGSWGLASGFSFYPGKNLGALGDGGAVLTSNPNIADLVRLYRNYGSKAKYEHLVVAGNDRLDALQALFLSIKLKNLKGSIERRRKLAERYLALIKNPIITLPQADSNGSYSAWHNFVLVTERRDELITFLTKNGIETNIHYPTIITSQPCYLTLDNQEDTPIARLLSQQIVSIPIYPELADDEQIYIIEKLNEFKT